MSQAFCRRPGRTRVNSNRVFLISDIFSVMACDIWKYHIARNILSDLATRYFYSRALEKDSQLFRINQIVMSLSRPI